MQLVEGPKDQIITLSVAPCIPKGIGVEITNGCAHGCIYCFSACGGSDELLSEVECYENCATVLREFLSTNTPMRIHLGYVTDFLGGHPKVREEVYKVLLQYPVIPVSMLTKGVFEQMDIEYWKQIGRRATIMVDLGCDDRKWETNVEPFKERLKVASELIGHCDVNCRLDPIIPGVNDNDEFFEMVCSELQGYGIKNIDCSYLFLTEPVIEAIEEKFDEDYADDLQRKYYRNDEEEKLNSAVPWTGREDIDLTDIRYEIDLIPLPSPDSDYRLETLQRLQAIGERYGIAVRLCTCKNRSMSSHAGTCSDARMQSANRLYLRLKPIVEQLWNEYRDSDKKVIKPPDLRRVANRYIELHGGEDRIAVKRKLKPVLENPLLFDKDIEKDNCGIHWRVYRVI